MHHSHSIGNSQLVMNRANPRANGGDVESVSNLIESLPVLVRTSHSYWQDAFQPILLAPISLGTALSHLLSKITMRQPTSNGNGSDGGHTEVTRIRDSPADSTWPISAADRTLVPFPAALVFANLDVSSTRGRAVQRRFAAS